MRLLSLFGLLLAACGDSGATADAPPPTPPTANPAREVVDTQLSIDLAATTGTATIVLGPSSVPGATLEIGDLAIERVQLAGADLPFAANASRLDLGLDASDQPLAVEIAYRWKHHEGFNGVSTKGYTLIWPYYCGNVFPCHSEPADGTTFQLELQNVPAGKTAVYPATLAAEAPSYQIAWSVDAYTELPLGRTAAGTELSVWYGAGELANAQAGSQHLVEAFQWFETHLGPYRFGPKAGTVSTKWGPGQFGGMEHHPFWHVGSAALSDIETHVHEAAHGWFGGGIRIACWEDFVLSEGTVSYLAARALDVVAPAVGAQVWAGYESELPHIPGTDKVWPQSCGAVDVLRDDLFTRAPYVRGAFFYRAVALKLGDPELLDRVLGTFYEAHATRAATMSEMLETIEQVTGYDARACAAMWLTGTTIPAVGPCP